MRCASLLETVTGRSGIGRVVGKPSLTRLRKDCPLLGVALAAVGISAMNNCEARLHADPTGMVKRLGELAEVLIGRLQLWTFARRSQTRVGQSAMDGYRQEVGAVPRARCCSRPQTALMFQIR